MLLIFMKCLRFDDGKSSCQVPKGVIRVQAPRSHRSKDNFIDTERALILSIPTAKVTGIDLGLGHITKAKRKNRTGLMDCRVGDAI